MRKAELNARLRAYARLHLSPTPEERALVSTVYASIQAVLGQAACLQIGSYPRFTAITPLHDLDVLNILGRWEGETDPSAALTRLEGVLRREYQNPTRYQLTIGRQTHSITLRFDDAQGDEVFSVDVVPAYISGRNEFAEDTYIVPEIAAKSRGDRRRLNDQVARGEHQMAWISSDPRGYITVAARTNAINDDFRKAVKIVKGWRASWKERDPDFPLKSFHLEQLVTLHYQQHPAAEIFDAVFAFFCELPRRIERSQIPDRADPTRKIDAYVDAFTYAQREQIARGRDHFLIGLENFAPGDDVAHLLAAGERERKSAMEAYLFDQNIPVLTEVDFSIVATVLERAGGFRRFILDALGRIEINRRIEFRLGRDAPPADVYKWKVKNDDNAPQPRGEITDHGTLRDPEETRYEGSHYVECFAIRDGVCIARSRQPVVLQYALGGRRSI